jgi:hypothetical protein
MPILPVGPLKTMSSSARMKQLRWALIFVAALAAPAHAQTTAAEPCFQNILLVNEQIIASVKEFPNVNPSLVFAVLWMESQDNICATNAAGARGIGQLMPATAKELGVTDFRDMPSTVRATTKHLSRLTTKFADSRYGGLRRTSLVLAAYNAGEGSVDAALTPTYTNCHKKSGKDPWLGCLPSETQNYVHTAGSVLMPLGERGFKWSSLNSVANNSPDSNSAHAAGEAKKDLRMSLDEMYDAMRSSGVMDTRGSDVWVQENDLVRLSPFGKEGPCERWTWVIGESYIRAHHLESYLREFKKGGFQIATFSLSSEHRPKDIVISQAIGEDLSMLVRAILANHRFVASNQPDDNNDPHGCDSLEHVRQLAFVFSPHTEDINASDANWAEVATARGSREALKSFYANVVESSGGITEPFRVFSKMLPGKDNKLHVACRIESGANWSIDANGTLTTEVDGALEEHPSLTYDDDDSKVCIRLEGWVSFNSPMRYLGKCVHMRFGASKHADCFYEGYDTDSIWYVDPVTQLPEEIGPAFDGAAVTDIVFSNYHKVGPVNLPFQVTLTFEDHVLTEKVLEAKADPDFPDALFSPDNSASPRAAP